MKSTNCATQTHRFRWKSEATALAKELSYFKFFHTEDFPFDSETLRSAAAAEASFLRSLVAASRSSVEAPPIPATTQALQSQVEATAAHAKFDEASRLIDTLAEAQKERRALELQVTTFSRLCPLSHFMLC